jgi:hypothetical protein
MEGVRESAILEFKRGFDLTSGESTCETIKDIIAMANSGGGVIVFGVEDNGDHSELFDCTYLLGLDLADLTNRVARYTGGQFSDFELVEVTRRGRAHAAMLIGEADVPIIFTKPGTYDVGGGKQKAAFGQGTIYFRHGAKSEPGSRDDLAKWRDRELERIRLAWKSGMRTVVEAPLGHVVRAVPTIDIAGPHATKIIEARITNDPTAQAFVPSNAEAIWPLRRSEVVKAVKEALGEGFSFTNHDLVCVGRLHNVLSTKPAFAFRSHPTASPQYSPAYAVWIADQIRSNAGFLEACRESYRNTVAKPKPRRKRGA